jgi:hypothetical protein
MSNAREIAQLGSVPSGRRNLIINGAMNVAQRNDEVTGQTETSGYKTVDRFQFWTYSGGTYTLSQDATEAPQGFAYSHKVLNTSAATTVAGTGVSFRQRIEAQDLQHLDYNTSSAKPVTLSFWVKSDTTGTYAVRIYNPDSVRMVTKTYAISTANTWEKKNITFSGDTGGVINNDSGYAFEVAWWLAAGTDFTSGSASGSWEAYSSTKEASGHNVNLNSGGNWYITGVQLEVGSVATEFEHRSYGEELALCQRYYRISKSNSAFSYILAAGQFESTTILQVAYDFRGMRIAPTITSSGGLVGEAGGGNLTLTGAGLVGSSFCRISFTGIVASTVGNITNIRDSGGNNAVVNFDAEL